MNVFTYNLFPTLVINVKNFLTEDQCSDIFKYVMTKHDDVGGHSALSNGSKSSHHLLDSNFLQTLSMEVDSCSSLFNDITLKIQEYVEKSGIGGADKPITLDNSWFNVQTVGSKLDMHTHPASFVSGALYINVDKDSSKLYFGNPVNLLSYTSISHYTDYTYQWFKFELEIGELILFPSFLTHGSGNEENKTENRTVISFNAS